MDATIKLNPVNGTWHVSDPHVKLDQNSGAHVLTFDIIGNSKDITFDPQDPLWIQMGSKPTAPPLKGADKGQIAGPIILNNGKQLVIVDWNSEAGQLNYHMNFKGYGPLDPIIDNGGGVKPPRPTYFSDFATLALVAAASFLIGMFVHKVLFASRRARSANPTSSKTP
ncbi:MAG: hypothetical protein ABI454_08975 [Sphingomicrobium sp.]